MGMILGGAGRRRWAECLVVLAVFAAATCLGLSALRNCRSPEGLSSVSCTTSFMGRPLMIALGRGSFHPDIESAPALKPFLEHQTDAFDPATLPGKIPVSDDSAAEYHLYLGWTVALIWRVFGISWPVLEPLMAVALGLCAVFVYGLFRLGMNRWLSLVGTALFVSSPAVLDQLNNLRDFSKAPFLLGGMLAIGWLAARRTPLRRPWLMAALMGLTAGVGMGFRQDAIILMPASLAGILFLSSHAVYRTFRRRIGATLVCAAAFLVVSAPMLVRMEGGAQPWHPLAQGFSMRHMDRCSLLPGVCEPLACSHDNFVFASIFSHAQRAGGNGRVYFRYNDPEDARFTRDWVVRTALQFPADTVARGYGSVLNVLCGADTAVAALRYHRGWGSLLAGAHGRIADFFRVAGLPVAILALLAAAAASPRVAVILVLLVLYFCGYVSLDNEWRHAFHLSFVCFWASGFVVQQLFSALAGSRRGGAPWGLWLRRAAAFLILGTLVLWTPWQAARLWQRRNIDGVMRQYASAPRAAVPVRAEPWRDLTLFRAVPAAVNPGQSLELAQVPHVGAFLRGISSIRQWDARCSLYAVHLRARQSGHRFVAKYWGAEEMGAPFDFTQVMRAAAADVDGGETWFFFPVYEFDFRTIFEGVAFARESADDFLGLYRVENSAQPLLLPCLTLNGPDGGPSRMTARLRIPYDRMQFFTPENEQVQLEESNEMALKLDRIDTAVFHARVVYALDPVTRQSIRLAESLEKAGQVQEALQILKSAILSSGEENFLGCAAMERFLQRNAAIVPARSVWRELAEQASSANLWRLYDQCLEPEDTAERLRVCRQLLQIAPGDLDKATKLQNLLADEAARLGAAGDLPGAVAACREAIPLNPRNNQPVLRLEELLAKSSPEERRSTWETVWKENPDNAPAAAFCGSARAASGELDGAKECFALVRRIAPNEWSYLVIAGDSLAAAGDWRGAVSAYEGALALNPKLDYLHSRLEEAKKRAADEPGPAEDSSPQTAAPERRTILEATSQ